MIDWWLVEVRGWLGEKEVSKNIHVPANSRESAAFAARMGAIVDHKIVHPVAGMVLP